MVWNRRYELNKRLACNPQGNVQVETASYSMENKDLEPQPESLEVPLREQLLKTLIIYSLLSKQISR